jgi:hypothetical protein
MTAKLRLISVTLQPEFVLDDGDNLTPIQTEPVKVVAAEWTDYPQKGFEEARAALEAELTSDN